SPEVEIRGPDLQLGGEGCLSLPGIGLPTVRAQRASVRGKDAKGKEVVQESEGVRARAFQPETDRLNGELYIDQHPAKVRKKIEDEMRASEWFGHHSLDPRGELYRRVQGFDEPDEDT